MDYICTNCNYKGPRKKVNRGSKLGAFLWWFVVPSIWGVFAGGDIMPKLSLDPIEAAQYLQNFSSGGLMQELILSCIPGAGYSIWRRMKKVYACPSCGSKIMISATPGADAGDMDDSEKDHVVEIERKLAEMERKLQEQKALQVTPIEQAVVAKPIVHEFLKAPVVSVPELPKEPPVKIEHTEESKKEW